MFRFFTIGMIVFFSMNTLASDIPKVKKKLARRNISDRLSLSYQLSAIAEPSQTTKQPTNLNHKEYKMQPYINPALLAEKICPFGYHVIDPADKAVELYIEKERLKRLRRKKLALAVLKLRLVGKV